MWDFRGKNRYYYRSRKVKGRTHVIYMGTGARGELAAAEDRLRWAQIAAAKQAVKNYKAQLDTAMAPLAAFASSTDHLIKATLLGAGYHQHDRGVWRKRKIPK